mgnify:CR=1 FL=1
MELKVKAVPGPGEKSVQEVEETLLEQHEETTTDVVEEQLIEVEQEVTADEVSVIPIPNGLNHQDAGPLLCGGITVFTPLVEFNITEDNKVGIIGIGGLGHLALKIYKALGCHVTAFTNSG